MVSVASHPPPLSKKDLDLLTVTWWGWLFELLLNALGNFEMWDFLRVNLNLLMRGMLLDWPCQNLGKHIFFSNSALLIAYVKELLMWNWQTVKMEYLWNSGELMCIGSYWFTQLQYCIKINALDVSNIYFLNVSLSGMQIRMKIC